MGSGLGGFVRSLSGICAIGTVALAGATGNGSVAANPLKSRLTAIDFVKCRALSRHRDGNAYRCPGLPGRPVHVASGDDRQFGSFGAAPQLRQAAAETPVAFNTIFERGKRPAIEWRIERRECREIPFATILRFHTQRDGTRGEVLVITKVDRRQARRLAVVDANVNPYGMALARAWADRNARTSGCDEPLQVIGKSGESPT